MDKEKVDMFIMTNAKYFPATQIEALRSRLLMANENKFNTASAIEKKDPTTMLLISLFLGGLGVDRFMLGDTGMGVLKLLTGGGCGIIALVDLFTVMEKTREYNFNAISAIL